MKRLTAVLLVLALVFGVVACSGNKVTVNFKAADGGVISSVSLEKGSVLEKPEDPVKEDYVFIGWFQEPELQNPFDFSSVIEADTDIYAKWLKEYSVEFISKGETVHSQKVLDGEQAEIYLPEDGETEFFNGWFKDESFNREYDFTAKVESDIKLYAKWSEFAVVKFYFEGEEVRSEKVKPGEIIKAPEKIENVQVIVSDWYKDKDCTEKFDFKAPVEESLILYAGEYEAISAWEFDNGTENWYIGYDSAGKTGTMTHDSESFGSASDGYIDVQFETNKYADSHIRIDGLRVDLDATEYNTVNMLYKNYGRCTDIRIYFQTMEYPGFYAYIQEDGRLVADAMSWQIYRFKISDMTGRVPVPDNPLPSDDINYWKGILTTLRIDFPTQEDNYLQISRIWLS